MKWAAGIFAVMLYCIWPYYTLVELAQAVRAGDAQTINRLVDWGRVRKSLKSQVQERLAVREKAPNERARAAENPGAAMAANSAAVTFANALIDKVLTPEGIALLVRIPHETRRAERRRRVNDPVTERPAKRERSSGTWRRVRQLLRRVKFAFFVSPIHFRLDLQEPRRAGLGVSLMLMFNGTGWQVSDVRLPKGPLMMSGLR